jgi:hypothetical protein
METGLQAVRDVVTEATLGEEVRHSVLWGLDQLPRLYDQLERTQDSRHFDDIHRHVEGMVNKLSGGKDSPLVAGAMLALLRGMHERLGIQVLAVKVPAPKSKVRKRAS